MKTLCKHGQTVKKLRRLAVRSGGLRNTNFPNAVQAIARGCTHLKSVLLRVPGMADRWPARVQQLVRLAKLISIVASVWQTPIKAG